MPRIAKREEVLFVRVTPREASDIKRAAQVRGLGVAAFVRFTLLEKLHATT
jgi:hypothetical protein